MNSLLSFIVSEITVFIDNDINFRNTTYVNTD